MTLKERWIKHPGSDFLVALLGGGLLALPRSLTDDAFFALAPTVAETAGVLLGMGAVVYGLFQ